MTDPKPPAASGDFYAETQKLSDRLSEDGRGLDMYREKLIAAALREVAKEAQLRLWDRMFACVEQSARREWVKADMRDLRARIEKGPL